jgi:hypothetical protein
VVVQGSIVLWRDRNVLKIRATEEMASFLAFLFLARAMH